MYRDPGVPDNQRDPGNGQLIARDHPRVMMVNPDGTRREIGPDDRHTINPYTLGQLDAQRRAPRSPLYDSPADAQRYAAGWLEHDLHRPVPNVLHPRWRWLPLIRLWRQLRRRR